MTAETGGVSTEGSDQSVLPRRRFLAVAGATIALAGLSACRPTVPQLPLPPTEGEPSTPPTAPGPLERSGWSPLVGKVATLEGPAGLVRAEVTEVTVATGASGADAEHRFSVLLRATDAVDAPSAVHRVTVEGLAPTDLFVSPVDRGAQHRWYQIIVNNPS